MLGTVSNVPKIPQKRSFRIDGGRRLGSIRRSGVEFVMKFLSLTFERFRKFPAQESFVLGIAGGDSTVHEIFSCRKFPTCLLYPTILNDSSLGTAELFVNYEL